MAGDIFCGPSLPIARHDTVLHRGQHHACGRDRLRRVEQKNKTTCGSKLAKRTQLKISLDDRLELAAAQKRGNKFDAFTVCEQWRMTLVGDLQYFETRMPSAHLCKCGRR
jgi:hypothetical protein